jgi:hypothetical protein
MMYQRPSTSMGISVRMERMFVDIIVALPERIPQSARMAHSFTHCDSDWGAPWAGDRKLPQCVLQPTV